MFPDPTTPFDHSDVTLLVEGQKLYTIKSFLASHSPFFNGLFFGNFEETGKDEVKIKDVTVEEMKTLLLILFHTGEAVVNDDNVEYILKLADRFQISVLVAECEKHLLRFSFDSSHLLFLAEQYKLEELKDRIITYAHVRDLRDFKQQPFFSDLSSSTKDKIIERLLQLAEMAERHSCFGN